MSVPTLEESYCLSVTKTNRIIHFWEIIVVCFGTISTLCGENAEHIATAVLERVISYEEGEKHAISHT
jgi:hypothetical protein